MTYGERKPHFRLMQNSGWTCWAYSDACGDVIPYLAGFKTLGECWDRYNRLVNGYMA